MGAPLPSSENDMAPPIIIYHKNCTDGFTAAWVAHRALGCGELVAANYGDAPPDVTGRDVIVVDFSYPRDTLVRMHAEAHTLLVLDHHVTAQKALDGLDFCVFDMTECGASLTWKHFHETSPPRIVEYVKDRDLWLWEKNWSREISAYIGSLDQGLEAWDRLHGELSEPQRLLNAVEGGAAILRFQRREVMRMGKDATLVLLKGIPVLAANVPVLISETGDYLQGESKSGAAGLWHVKGDRAYWSLRSDGRVNVADLAQTFGGGGHPRAAGFTVSVQEHVQIMGWTE